MLHNLGEPERPPDNPPTSDRGALAETSARRSWFCQTKLRWIGGCLAAIAIPSAAMGLLVAWQIEQELPPLAGRILMETVRVRPAASTFVLDPMAKLSTFSVAGLPPQQLPRGAELAFKRPQSGTACDSFTLTAEFGQPRQINWTPHDSSRPNAACMVRLIVQPVPGVQSEVFTLTQNQALTLVVAEDSVLLSNLDAEELVGKIPDEGLSESLALLNQLFKLSSLSAMGSLDLTLTGALNMARLSVVTAGNRQPRFEVLLAGGELRGGMLGTSDLQSRVRHLRLITFGITFASVFGVLLGVLQLLLKIGWAPCAPRNSEPDRTPKTTTEMS